MFELKTDFVFFLSLCICLYLCIEKGRHLLDKKTLMGTFLGHPLDQSYLTVLRI